MTRSIDLKQSEKEELKPDCYGRRYENGSFKFPIFDEPITPDDEGLKLLTMQKYGEILEALDYCRRFIGQRIMGTGNKIILGEAGAVLEIQLERLLSSLSPQVLSTQATKEGE